ncbi:MAG: hypothetical protein ACKPGB_08300, partial [Dolichospermum sp.]
FFQLYQYTINSHGFVKGKDFYCLEPWSATRNAFNTGDNLTVLAPGASCTAAFQLTANFF